MRKIMEIPRTHLALNCLKPRKRILHLAGICLLILCWGSRSESQQVDITNLEIAARHFHMFGDWLVFTVEETGQGEADLNGDGDVEDSVIYVHDLRAGETINLGFGKGISVGDLARRLMAVAGVEVPIRHDNKRVRPEKSEVLVLVSNNQKAGRLLGWRPFVTLEEGLAATLEFFRLHQALRDAMAYEV